MFGCRWTDGFGASLERTSKTFLNYIKSKNTCGLRVSVLNMIRSDVFFLWMDANVWFFQLLLHE